MKHTQDEILIAREIAAPDYLFRMEEYWEEDDAGYCCVDYILAKHTRLRVMDPAGQTTVKIFDFDSLEYEKTMELDGDILTVTYHPEVDVEEVRRINVRDLTLL